MDETWLLPALVGEERPTTGV